MRFGCQSGAAGAGDSCGPHLDNEELRGPALPPLWKLPWRTGQADKKKIKNDTQLNSLINTAVSSFTSRYGSYGAGSPHPQQGWRQAGACARHMLLRPSQVDP